MEIKVIQGHPGMVDATAFILPTNEHLHLRGQLGDMLKAVGGPMIQNDVVQKAFRRISLIVAVEAGATSYDRIYAVAIFPHKGGDILWLNVEKALCEAITQAYNEGHRKIAIPFFLDLPNYDVNVFGETVAKVMFHAVSNFDKHDLHILFVCKNPREYEILNEVRTAFFGAVEEAEDDASNEQQALFTGSVDKPVDKPVENVTKTEKKEESKSKPISKRTTSNRRGNRK